MVRKYITRLNNSQDGFSLMEIMICIIIMLISVSFLRVSFKAVDDISLQYEAVYLVNELRNIQKRSKINSVDNKFYVDNKEQKDKIIIKDAHEYMINTMGISELHQLSNNIAIRSNRRNIFFSGDNTANTTTIYLINEKSEIKIIIDTVGRIRIMR